MIDHVSTNSRAGSKGFFFAEEDGSRIYGSVKAPGDTELQQLPRVYGLVLKVDVSTQIGAAGALTDNGDLVSPIDGLHAFLDAVGGGEHQIVLAFPDGIEAAVIVDENPGGA